MLESATESPPKRRGGRQKGVKNKRTLLGSDFVKPLLPAAKRRLKALVEGDNDDLAYRAAKTIIEYSYGKPTETKLVGGDGGEPIRQIVATDGISPDKELARRISYIMAEAKGGAAGGAGAAALPVPSPENKSENSGEKNGVGVSPVFASLEKNDAEIEAPPEGSVLRFVTNDWSIHAVPGDRPNLPTVYCLFKGGQFVRRGMFEAMLALLRERVDALGPWVVEAPKAQPNGEARPAEMGARPAVPKVFHRRSQLP